LQDFDLPHEKPTHVSSPAPRLCLNQIVKSSRCNGVIPEESQIRAGLHNMDFFRDLVHILMLGSLTPGTDFP
jgi:hypothetical protein